MIPPLTDEGLMWVMTHLRKADELEVKATIWQGDWEATIGKIAAIPGLKLEARLDRTQEPVVIGGVVPIWSGLCSGWLFGTDKFKRLGLQVTRTARNALRGLDEGGLRRIEVRPIEGNYEVVRWLRLLGFSCEAILTQFGQHGENFFLFSRVTNDTPTTH